MQCLLMRASLVILIYRSIQAHAGVPQDFAASVRAFGNDLEAWPEEQRQRALQMIVHACDIGNPAKSLDSSLLWSERILAENFAQVRMPLLHRVVLCALVS